MWLHDEESEEVIFTRFTGFIIEDLLEYDEDELSK